jgi:predicted CopG family antitoxin
MMTKTIKISVKTHKLLSELASKNETFNDVIAFLIDYYRENEEFSDKQAETYTRDIEKFEKGDMENVSELTLSELEKRITKLENEIKK